MAKQKLGPLQKEWVRCLRSGKFPQGRVFLIQNNPHADTCDHCCLGVACLVAEANGVKGEWRLRNEVWLFDGANQLLPASVVEAMKFHKDSGGVKTDKQVKGLRVRGAIYTSLAVANDGGVTFDKIADFVESHPEAVFTEAA